MTKEQIQQFADTILGYAEELLEDSKHTMHQPVIHPQHIVSTTVVTAGKLQGTARALEWHAKHHEGDD